MDDELDQIIYFLANKCSWVIGWLMKVKRIQFYSVVKHY